MYISREKLYALGEPFGNDCTRKVAGRTIYGKGGSQSSTTTQSIPTELKPLATAFANKAMDYGNKSFNWYDLQRYADPTKSDMTGIKMLEHRAANGDPTMNSGANFLQNQLSAGPASAAKNPYAKVTAGTNNTEVKAGTNTSQVNAGANQYMGSNPYLDAAVNRAQANVTNNWNNMTKPQTEAAGVRSGSFGNSGMDQTLQNQQAAAGKQMGDIASQMYGADYANTQQLAESGLNRGMQAQQFNSGITDNNINRNLNAQQFNSGTKDSNLNRSLTAATTTANLGESYAGRQDAATQNQAHNQLQAANLATTYGNADYNDANQMMNAGAARRGLEQPNLDFRYQQFQDQQNMPVKQLQAMSGVFGSNLGGTSTTTGRGGGK